MAKLNWIFLAAAVAFGCWQAANSLMLAPGTLGVMAALPAVSVSLGAGLVFYFSALAFSSTEGRGRSRAAIGNIVLLVAGILFGIAAAFMTSSAIAATIVVALVCGPAVINLKALLR